MNVGNEFAAGQRSIEARAFDAAKSVITKKMQRYLSVSALGTAALASACEKDPELADLREMNTFFARRELLPVDVQHMEVLNNLLVQYVNDEFIGTRVMPELSTNGNLNGNYWAYTKEDQTAYPEDTVGIGGRVQPNELNRTKTELEYNLKIRSFIEYLEWHTVENQAAPLNEVMDTLFNVMYGLQFKREARIAAAVFNANNYASTNKVTLTGLDRFENDGGDPQGVIDDAKASVWGGNGPGKLVLVMGRSVYKALKFHAQLTSRINGGATTDRAAMVNQRLMAELLEVDEVIVGAARHNTGTFAAPTYARMWTTTSMALVRVAPPSKSNAAFGYTFNAYPAKHTMFWKPEEGSAGVWMARATLCDAPKVVAADTSYLFTTATSS